MLKELRNRDQNIGLNELQFCLSESLNRSKSRGNSNSNYLNHTTNRFIDDFSYNNSNYKDYNSTFKVT